ncbi:hypothetical protein ACEPPN_017929 [Leptodophora sp. 'Broadleaf-Isolate-01']
MEALAALALAGNIIQFVEFSSKLFSRGCELYKSTDGRLAVDDEIRLITSELQVLIRKMRCSGTSDAPVLTGLGHDSNFEKICCEAVKIAESILEKLEQRKIDEGGNRKRETFRRVWCQMWSQGEVEALVERLKVLKDAINSGMLAAILQNTNELNAQMLGYVQKSDAEAQLLLKAVLESTQASKRDIVAAVALLTSRMEMFSLEDERRTRDMIMRENYDHPSLLSLDVNTLEWQVFTLSQWDEDKLRWLVSSSILNHLLYTAMPKRYESVVEAHPKTFEWALQDADSRSLNKTNLSTWLKSEHGLYWISGKPGSGKSTLMKHILDDERTQIYLERWAHQEPSAPLVVASFFFWNSGTLEQRSQIGMLRSLLFQVLDQKPKLLPIILPSLWLRQYRKYLADGPRAVWSEGWTLRVLMTAFRRLMTQKEVSCKLFFLIDGLDEFDGDHEVLAELFNDITKTAVPNGKTSVKVCVSSRPYVVFRENFEGCPTLAVQDLTMEDITLFVSDRFHGNSAFQKLALREPEATTELIQAVVSKASGVFLWVFIVVKDLLRGIRNRDTISDLWRRLDALPPELEPLYQRLVDQIEPVYDIWASKAFQLLWATRQIAIPTTFKALPYNVLTIAELYLALDERLRGAAVEQMTQTELDTACRETEYHITARCACLLEVTRAPRMSDGKVQYIHRTAKDFLEEPSRWAAVLAQTKNTNFDPFWSIFGSKEILIHQILTKRSGMEIQRDAPCHFIVMLALAMKIAPHNAILKKKMLVLENAEGLLTTHRIDLMNQVHFSPWFAEAPDTQVPLNMQSSLLSCALALNFSEYVATRLSVFHAQSPSAAKLAATLMLRRHASADDWLYTQDVQAFGFEMATILVEKGADVNDMLSNVGGRTMWEHILADQIDISSGLKDIDPALPKFMRIALAHGADPNAVLPAPSACTLDEYVETNIRPAYPVEAGKVLRDIAKAREPPQQFTTLVVVREEKIRIRKKRYWWKRII